jgi:Glucosidase II beta subunit-like protein
MADVKVPSKKRKVEEPRFNIVFQDHLSLDAIVRKHFANSEQEEEKTESSDVKGERSREETNSRVIEMHDRKGKAYRCVLPPLEVSMPAVALSLQETAKGENRAREEDDDDDDDERTSVGDCLNALAPLEGNCLQRAEDWWTYELCFGRYVRQFRRGAAPDVAAQVPSAGRVVEPGDESEFWLATSLDDSESAISERAPVAFAERYVGGDFCPLTKKPRRVEVRYVCDASLNAVNPISSTLVSIREPSSCVYSIVVGTALLCPLDAFKPADVPTPTHNIVCYARDEGARIDAHQFDLLWRYQGRRKDLPPAHQLNTKKSILKKSQDDK